MMNKSSLLFIGLAAAILITLFLVFKPQDTAPQAEGLEPQKAYAFTIRGGKKTAGPNLLEVSQGTQVHLVINSDQADELHVHGYDLSRELPAGDTVRLDFAANISGRFEIELHRAHAQLGVLQVLPK